VLLVLTWHTSNDSHENVEQSLKQEQIRSFAVKRWEGVKPNLGMDQIPLSHSLSLSLAHFSFYCFFFLFLLLLLLLIYRNLSLRCDCTYTMAKLKIIEPSACNSIYLYYHLAIILTAILWGYINKLHNVFIFNSAIDNVMKYYLAKRKR
jgi:hypothetical protein